MRILPPNEDIDHALISSAADESNINNEVVAKVKESGQADAPGYDSGDDSRPIIRRMVPQGVDAFGDVSPPGSDETTTSDVGTQGLWDPQVSCDNWVNVIKARTPHHVFKSVSKL